MIHTRTLPGNYGSASALGAALGLLSFPVLSKVLANLPLPVSLHYFDQHMSGWLALRLNPLAPELLSSVAERYTDYLSNLPPDIPAWALTGRFDAALAVSAALALGITWLVGQGRPDTRVIAGRTLHQGKKAHRVLRRRAKENCAVSGAGLKLHPNFDWQLSLDQETRHFLIQGSVGGGKTQILWPLINAAITRGELRAELASYFLASRLGIPHDTEQHAAYVGSWIQALSKDHNEIFRAAKDAERITEFVLAFQQEQTQQKTATQTAETATVTTPQPKLPAEPPKRRRQATKEVELEC